MKLNMQGQSTGNNKKSWVCAVSRPFWICSTLSAPFLFAPFSLPNKHISSSLSNRAILYHPCSPCKYTILLLLASLFILFTCSLPTPHLSLSLSLLALLCTWHCGRDGEMLVNKTHAKPCPHGASVLWQETSLPRPLKTLLFHEVQLRCYFLSSLNFQLKLFAHNILCTCLYSLLLNLLLSL